MYDDINTDAAENTKPDDNTGDTLKNGVSDTEAATVDNSGTASHLYSMVGDSIPENKTEINRSIEFEVSYDSASGRYTHTEYEHAAESPSSPFTSAEKAEKQARKSNRGGFIVGIIALGLVLSCTFGALSGFVAYAIASGSTGSLFTGIKETGVNIKTNNANVDTTALMSAAAAAQPTVVAINVFSSEASYESGKVSGSGSGVIWSPEGYIATCNHVIDNSVKILVTLSDKSTYPAEIVGTDEQTDLAVIKIDVGSSVKLESVMLRGTDLMLGESVLAIGNPLGTLSNTVTNGIISCLARQITVEGLSMTLVQTNAAVNPGNSGGGLYDINGSLVGIVNAKSASDSIEGIGFAIPIATAKSIINDLIEVGYVTGRPFFGFTSVYVDIDNYRSYPTLEEYAVRSGIWGIVTVTKGIYITDISSSIQYSSGNAVLSFGDRIIKIGETQISGIDDYTSALNSYEIGDTVSITVSRKGKTETVVNLVVIPADKSAK